MGWLEGTPLSTASASRGTGGAEDPACCSWACPCARGCSHCALRQPPGVTVHFLSYCQPRHSPHAPSGHPAPPVGGLLSPCIVMCSQRQRGRLRPGTCPPPWGLHCLPTLCPGLSLFVLSICVLAGHCIAALFWPSLPGALLPGGWPLLSPALQQGCCCSSQGVPRPRFSIASIPSFKVQIRRLPSPLPYLASPWEPGQAAALGKAHTGGRGGSPGPQDLSPPIEQAGMTTEQQGGRQVLRAGSGPA